MDYLISYLGYHQVPSWLFTSRNPSSTSTFSQRMSGDKSYFVSVFDGPFQRPGTYPSLSGLPAHKVFTDLKEEALDRGQILMVTGI